MQLKDRVAIITAAASGMGRAGAWLFAREGASLALVDRDGDALRALCGDIAAQGGKALPLEMDLRNDAHATGLVEQTCAHYGGVDVLWNHVGDPGPGAFEQMDPARYEQAMDLNLRSVLLTTRAAIEKLRASDSGAVLFTASVVGLVGSKASPVYGAAKHAVIGLMKSLALRYAAEGIRFNAICPGGVETPMLELFTGRPDDETAPGEGATRAKLIEATPMQRVAQPEEIARAALFLLSDAASYITGVALPVDGGYSAR